MGIGAIVLAGILSSLTAIGVGSAENQANIEAQKEANEKNLELNELANATNLELNRETNETNLQIARENREFQLEMSNTAHQREVADLKAAGLNPVLSANSSGAPMITVSNANQNPGSVNAGSVNPVGTDLSYVNTAINTLTSTLLLATILGGKGLDVGNDVRKAMSLVHVARK